MSSLRLRHLRIRVCTSADPFGVDIPFTDGLNLVRADNTSGKSTCFQAIAYALGLDAMLTPRQHELPLKQALTTRIHDAKEDREVPVTSSEFWLEIEGSGGRRATIYRPIYGLGDHRHVTVYDGLSIDDDLNDGTDMLVRVSGTAQSELGFHHWLAKFLNWELPSVDHADGRQSLLYLETIFPLFFVEQQFGWSKIQGNMPFRFGIRDVARRATEFVLNLTVAQNQLRRNSLQKKREDLATKYVAAAKAVEALATLSSCAVRGVPEIIPAATLQPTLLVVRENLWKPIEQRLAELESNIDAARTAANERLRSSSRQLFSLQEKRMSLRSSIADASQQRQTESQERNSLTRRQTDLADQISKLKDLRLLSRVGGNTEDSFVAANCPTCWQPVADSVRPDTKSVMSLEETIGFAEAELALLSEARQRSHDRYQALSASIKALETQLDEVDSALDAAESFSGTDVAEVKAFLSMQQERQSLIRLNDEFARYVGHANAIISESIEIAAEIKRLPVGLTNTDSEKLGALEVSFKEQEREYGFTSIPVNDLSIGRETYKPSVGDFELGFETSASDTIRTIWSYLLGLLEAHRSYKDMNHIGLVLFDEPKQQSIKNFSFGQLLRHAAISRHYKEQIVFFTSEDRGSINETLKDETFSIIDFSGQILQPLR